MTDFIDRERGAQPSPPVVSTSVLDRMLMILDTVRRFDEPVSVTELSTLTSMPKSTVSRVVSALADQRYLERTPDGIALGIRLFELGSRACLPRRLIAAAAPVIRSLHALTGERIGLWVHRDDEMVSIAAVPGRLPMLSTRAGMRSPALTTASGKAFLAFCDDTDIIDRVSAPLHHDAAANFRAELVAVRDSSVATDDGVAYPGILALATPVLSNEGTVVGAISIAGPAGAMLADSVRPLVRDAGTDLSRRLSAA